MSADVPTAEELQRIFEAIDGLATVGRVGEALADARDIPEPEAADLVEQAINEDLLDERDTGGMFPELVVVGSSDSTPSEDVENSRQSTGNTEEYDVVDNWTAVDFTTTEPGVWSQSDIERKQWMGHESGDKAPFAPWGDKDAPVKCDHHDEHTTCAECWHDARYKWGYRDNYADHETALEWAEMDPRLAGLAFIQREDDPSLFVDGDDVRCPETGDVHPAFKAILNHLGLTYGDVSVSGSGVHARYRGELPEEIKQAAFEIDDEAWGANDEDDLPTIEIYDGKHVCIATGEHLPGTPVDEREIDEDALHAILEANDQFPTRREDAGEAYEDFDGDDYDPGATSADETTDDIRDIFSALDRLDARRVAAETIVQQWNDDATTSDGKRAFYPTWGSTSDSGTANVVDDRIWQDTGDRGGYGGPVVMALIDLGELDDRGVSPRDASGELWWKGVDHLRELGFDIPEYNDTDDIEYRPDPRTVDVVVDPRRAWDAADRVVPDDLDGESIDLEESDDGWCCPHCEATVDVVRAVAIADGLVDSCDEPLGAEYARAYQRGRESHEAPLPRYLTSQDATARYELVIGAIEELTFWDLDQDAIQAEITGENSEVDGDAVLTLDPSPIDGWRDSESGESVLVFESGIVWDADTETSIDPLRFVALENGLIDSPTDSLQGSAFTQAYDIARAEYGAPLPKYQAGSPDGHVPLLPPAEGLLGSIDDQVDDELQAARDEVEELLLEAIQDEENPSVIRALPALGKTTSAIKNAKAVTERDSMDGRPISYLAPRLPLMQQAAETADEHDVEWAALPVFGGSITKEARSQAVSHVREHGKGTLRDRWSLIDAVDADHIIPEDDEDSDEVTEFEQHRDCCPTAAGGYTEAWALTANVAYELGYTPRDIHERSEALFGAPLPCQEDGDCPYSRAWDRVTDPDQPFDLLIGHYSHAHVESVKTLYTSSPNGQIERHARTVVVDEFPGLEYTREFGEEALDHATWLASSLRGDIDDRQDMIEADLWNDEWVRGWLEGDTQDLEPVADSLETLQAFEHFLEAINGAEGLLDNAEDSLKDDGLAAPLQELVDDHQSVLHNFDSFFQDLDRRFGKAVANSPDEAAKFYGWIEDAVIEPLGSIDPDSFDRDPSDIGDRQVGEDLRSLIDRAVEVVENGAVEHRGVITSAQTALLGGEDGARELSVWADGGWAHRDAHHLLRGVITPIDSSADRIETQSLAFDDSDDGTVLKRVTDGGITTLLDRNHQGAYILDPPDRTGGHGEPSPFVGLDATGRQPLWSLALGTDVQLRDIHNSPRERAEFLRDIHGLQVMQIGEEARPYEGDPGGKDLDSDVELIRELHDRFCGVHGPRDRDEDVTQVTGPAAITSKDVRQVLEADDRLDDLVEGWDHFGNITGENDLGKYTLAAILGSPHYGHGNAEKMAAFAGEEVRWSGRGMALDYGCKIGNEYLKHMREDQLLQAALRFARGESGALVAIRSGAIPRDLPVIGKGRVATTWSETATTIAEYWRRHPSDSFTVSDIVDLEDVDVGRRQVRRLLAELTQAGYLQRHDPGEGLANEFTPTGPTPKAAEFELPETSAPGGPGSGSSRETYTANVRVAPPDELLGVNDESVSQGVPAPETAEEVVAGPEPPG